jgi:hypothetical protein
MTASAIATSSSTSLNPPDHNEHQLTVLHVLRDVDRGVLDTQPPPEGDDEEMPHAEYGEDDLKRAKGEFEGEAVGD